MSDDFYSFYGSGQKTEESKPEAEVKKPSGVQTRKLAPVTVAPSASVPTPIVPDRPLAEPDPRQIDQATLAQQAQTGLTKAGPPQAPSVVNAMSDTGKDLLPYAIGAGGAYGLSKLFDMFNKKGGDGGPPPPPGGPTHQDEINRLKLEREQLKNEKAKIEHQNWLAKNTLTEAEQIFGRKAKDATELRLMEKAYEQQKSGVVGATPPPSVPPAPVAPALAPAAAPAASVAPPAPPVAPPAAPAPQPAVVQPANVISTGPTPEAAAAPIEKAEKVKAVTQPSEKPAPKAKKPIDPSEVGLTKEQIGMKRYLESFYGGGEIGAKTYGQVGEILGYTPAFEPGKGGGLKPEENQIIKGYRKENIAGPKVNLDKEMKRGLKGGVGIAALMAIPGFADAAQRKDYGRMAEIASDFAVPPFAGSTELGVSTLGEKQLKAFENAQKLGSPYRSVPPR